MISNRTDAWKTDVNLLNIKSTSNIVINTCTNKLRPRRLLTVQGQCPKPTFRKAVIILTETLFRLQSCSTSSFEQWSAAERGNPREDQNPSTMRKEEEHKSTPHRDYYMYLLWSTTVSGWRTEKGGGGGGGAKGKGNRAWGRGTGAPLGA